MSVAVDSFRSDTVAFPAAVSTTFALTNPKPGPSGAGRRAVGPRRPYGPFSVNYLQKTGFEFIAADRNVCTLFTVANSERKGKRLFQNSQMSDCFQVIEIELVLLVVNS